MSMLMPPVPPTSEGTDILPHDSGNLPPTRLPPVGTHPKRRLRGFRIIVVLAIVVSCSAVVAGFFVDRSAKPGTPAPHTDDAHDDSASAATTPTVKVVKPKLESAVPIIVEPLATVEPYYRADLRARASGLVRVVHADIGDKVKQGDVLIEIDVPDSEQDVAQKRALIVQAEQELKVSESKLQDTIAAKDVAKATIKQRQADVQSFTATRDLKQGIYQRYQDLAKRGTVVGSLVEDQKRDYLSAEGGVAAAEAAIEKAQADFAEASSKVEGARADIEFKKSRIEVARKDLERALVVLEFGKVRAPFDGVIVRRSVDPGSFVQNATTGNSEALISISRVDIVTVAAKVPDDAAPLIARGTPCEIQIDDLPGGNIPGKVTRFSPSIMDSDRTIRVEVDLFNGDEAEYTRVLEMFKPGSKIRPKGIHDTVPERAFPAGHTEKRLLPGMTGTMKLAVGGFGKSFVLPSTCIYNRSGVAYILLVEQGKTRQYPVRVQLNDGRIARVLLISTNRSADGTSHEVLGELTGNEEVVAARQLEIGDGTSVRVSYGD